MLNYASSIEPKSSQDPTKAPKKEGEAVEEVKPEPEEEKKLTPAEYRRLHPYVAIQIIEISS